MTFVIVIRIFDYCGFQPCICIRALFFQSLIDTLYSLHLLTGPEFEAYVVFFFPLFVSLDLLILPVWRQLLDFFSPEQIPSIIVIFLSSTPVIFFFVWLLLFYY